MAGRFLTHANLFVVICFIIIVRCHAASADTATAHKVIESLCSKEWEGRPTSMRTARKFQHLLKSYRYRYKLTTQRFEYNKDSTITAKNFILHKCNLTKAKFMILAHYDHLGYGGAKSKELNNTCLHKGADDNASGVALALMLLQSLPHSILSQAAFAFTAGHEDGLYGSQSLASMFKKKYHPSFLVINLDMVGRLDTTTHRLRVETNLPLVEYRETGIHAVVQPVVSTGEHTAFVQNGFHVMYMTTGIHDDYHKCSDTPEEINYAGMELIKKYIEKTLTNLAVD